jgi:predicted NAD/FAD-binding protein
MRIAVIGGGISGLGAAWALSRRHAVTIYESERRLGGHANTVEIADADRVVAVDTGFIVYNERTYHNLTRLFAATGVATGPSDMSFAVSRDGGRFEYRASAAGLLAQLPNLARGTYRSMVRDMLRFMREAPALVGSGSTERLGEFLDRGRYGEPFRRDFLLPMLACIWSSSLDGMLDYPAESMARFLDNHGLLRVIGQPRWRTVTGGSREYVRRLSAGFARDVRLATPVQAVQRHADGVVVRDARGGADRFHHVVFATHADITLRILGPDASPTERAVLSAFRYQENRAVLHRDPSLMPRRRRVWSSWNYLADGDDGSERVSLSYWMNRLQNLRTERPVILTLNPSREPRHVESEHIYHHPQFDGGAVNAQLRLPGIQGVDRTWFVGAWTGYGFHEDGLRSGLEVAAALGAPAPWWASRTVSHPERQMAGAVA